jgi:hypothetical protein
MGKSAFSAALVKRMRESNKLLGAYFIDFKTEKKRIKFFHLELSRISACNEIF